MAKNVRDKIFKYFATFNGVATIILGWLFIVYGVWFFIELTEHIELDKHKENAYILYPKPLTSISIDSVSNVMGVKVKAEWDRSVYFISCGPDKICYFNPYADSIKLVSQ